MNSDARMAMAMAGPLVLPEIRVGMMDVSMTRKPCTPRTRKRVSTTERENFCRRGSVECSAGDEGFCFELAKEA